MTTLLHDATSNCYFAVEVSSEDLPHLAQLLWQPHPQAKDCWWTGSPYLAAPFWYRIAPDDVATKAVLEPYAWNYWTSFSKDPIAGTGVDTIRIPTGRRPFNFQVAGVQRGVRQKRMLLGDEPGLGKSCQALTIANMTRPKRLVIACPTSIVYNWAAECERWLVDPCAITILDGAKKSVPDRGVTIVPYSRGHSFHRNFLSGPKIDMLVLDEEHQLKEPDARRTIPWLGNSKTQGIAEAADRVIAMSGTPVPNNPLEIHGIMKALSPDTMKNVSRERFKQLYCSTFKGTAKVATKGGGEASVQFEKNSGKNESALNAELRASGIMVRRMKNDVLDQLPPKHVHLVHLTPTAEIEALVKEEATLYDMLQTRLIPAHELMAIQGHIANVRARLGALKAPKIAEYLRFIFESGETRVVCFMLHREAMEIIRKSFEMTRIRVRIVSGSESPRQRQADVDAFQRPGGYELLIGQVYAAGVGLTMTAARYCVLGEIAWTPAINDQAIDRVHRISQTRQVEAPIATFPHAVEERVIRANAAKAISARNILDVNLQTVLGEKLAS